MWNNTVEGNETTDACTPYIATPQETLRSRPASDKVTQLYIMHWSKVNLYLFKNLIRAARKK